jgi:hypothetical protein
MYKLFRFVQSAYVVGTILCGFMLLLCVVEPSSIFFTVAAVLILHLNAALLVVANKYAIARGWKYRPNWTFVIVLFALLCLSIPLTTLSVDDHKLRFFQSIGILEIALLYLTMWKNRTFFRRVALQMRFEAAAEEGKNRL